MKQVLPLGVGVFGRLPTEKYDTRRPDTESDMHAHIVACGQASVKRRHPEHVYRRHATRFHTGSVGRTGSIRPGVFFFFFDASLVSQRG